MVIFRKYNFNKYNLLEKDNGFKKYYPITQLFEFLKQDKSFCISYNINKTCKLCAKNESVFEFYTPILKFSSDDINQNSIKDLIINITSNYYTRCDKCGYADSKCIENTQINQTVSCVYSNIFFSDFLSIMLDLRQDFNFTELFNM